MDPHVLHWGEGRWGVRSGRGQCDLEKSSPAASWSRSDNGDLLCFFLQSQRLCFHATLFEFAALLLSPQAFIGPVEPVVLDFSRTGLSRENLPRRLCLCSSRGQPLRPVSWPGEMCREVAAEAEVEVEAEVEGVGRSPPRFTWFSSLWLQFCTVCRRSSKVATTRQLRPGRLSPPAGESLWRRSELVPEGQNTWSGLEWSGAERQVGGGCRYVLPGASWSVAGATLM